MESVAAGLTPGALGPASFGIAFLGGLVAGLGPCVLPMLPAVFGYVTGAVEDAPGGRSPAVRGLALAGVFVFGMSSVFSAIGAIAGLLGRALIVSAPAYYLAAAVCLAIGLQMTGLIALPLDRLNRFLPMRRPEGRGFIGALLFGAMFGLVATPCSTPILAAIAAIAAGGGNAAGGAALLFVYGIGKGTPLLALGVASGSLALMRPLSRAAGTLSKIGGVGMLSAAAYLVWIA